MADVTPNSDNPARRAARVRAQARRRTDAADSNRATDPARSTEPSRSSAHEAEPTAGIDQIASPQARPTREIIAKRAYARYLERGAADGQDLDDWLSAEQELAGLGDPTRTD